MAELLLELFSEEIPSRMQVRAAEDLKRLVTEGLRAQGLAVGTAHAFSTPRRLALAIEDLPEMSPGVSEEKKGPRVGAPEQAVQGFLKSAGLASLDQAEIVRDEKKGDYYVARIEKAGRPAGEIVSDVVTGALAKFPWPKSMRWGSASFQWIRPLKSIVCLIDGKVVPVEVAGIKAGDLTRGHRFHGNEPFAVSSFEDYASKLATHAVMLNAAERAEEIREQAEGLAHKAKLKLVPDEALLAENAGLAEWPVVLMGEFDKSFLEVPAECLMTSMKQHQKCFSLSDPKTGKLANKFILVSNLTAADGGAQIVAGNEKVIRARLSDATFFWEQDLKRSLDEMANALDGITFHEKLGTQKERVERIAELAFQLAGTVDANPEDARRAAQLSKADLVSGMVGEFPELQGLMGRYYAERAGAKPEIARAIELHYKPKGPTDVVPKEDEGDAVAIAVALADKLDTLVGFWAIDEKPTGSKDPYALRRAALGVIRLVVENNLVLPLNDLPEYRILTPEQIEIYREPDTVNFDDIKVFIAKKLLEQVEKNDFETLDADELITVLKSIIHELNVKNLQSDLPENKSNSNRVIISDPGLFPSESNLQILSFFYDRLKVQLRDQGARHDLVDAVLGAGGASADLLLIVRRVEALTAFLKSDDGANLLAGYKRAANILKAEEKKDGTTFDGVVNEALIAVRGAPEEQALAAAIAVAWQAVSDQITAGDYAGALTALAALRPAVDAFFEKILVNDPDPAIRASRLNLLAHFRAATLPAADFGLIAG